MVLIPEMATDGKLLTVTNCETVLEHPLEAVPVTVYVALFTGETVFVGPVGPPDHEYVEAPLAVKVVDEPLQIVVTPEMDTVGTGLTVTN